LIGGILKKKKKKPAHQTHNKIKYLKLAKKSDMNCPINVVSYGQIAFYKSFILRLVHRMRICSPKHEYQVSAGTEASNGCCSDAMTIGDESVSDWLFFLRRRDILCHIACSTFSHL